MVNLRIYYFKFYKNCSICDLRVYHFSVKDSQCILFLSLYLEELKNGTVQHGAFWYASASWVYTTTKIMKLWPFFHVWHLSHLSYLCNSFPEFFFCKFYLYMCTTASILLAGQNLFHSVHIMAYFYWLKESVQFGCQAEFNWIISTIFRYFHHLSVNQWICKSEFFIYFFQFTVLCLNCTETN